MFRSSRFRVLAATLAMASVALSVPLSASAGAVARPSGWAVVSPAVSAPAGSRSLGAMASSTTMHFSVYLNSRNPSGLAAYAANVTNRHSVGFGHYLAPGAFARRFGASSATRVQVASVLRASGLRVSGGSVDGLELKVSGNVATIDRTFSTTIDRFRLANGTVGSAAVSSLRLPRAIGSQVLGVIGLNNLVHPTSAIHSIPNHLMRPSTLRSGRSFNLRPHSLAGAPSACASAVHATQQGFGGITDDQVANAYGVSGLYGAGDFAAGQTVAVYELEPFSMSDVATFEQCYFGASHTSNISTINVDGGPGVGNGSGESALDIQDVAAIAPAAHIAVYQAPNTTAGALDAYGRIVADDTAKVVTTSWGLCESVAMSYSPGSLAVEHLLFEQAAAQGQTVFAAAGDSGANDCLRITGHVSKPATLSVDDPAAQPYVVAVGGTTAISVSNPPSEQVWNDGAQGGAGGGGASNLWAAPSWQRNVSAVAASAPKTSCGAAGTQQCRVLPDVSAFADEFTGITINYGGQWGTIGGTSSAAPLWAAMLAEVNASSSCQSSLSTANGVGFLSPLLYEVAGNPTLAAQGLNDVTAGNNDQYSTNALAYPATTGFDAASGFGSPNLYGAGGTGLASSLCAAAQESTTSSLASVSPRSGSNSGGTIVTISGSGFETGSLSNVSAVDFGDVPAASFTVDSSTQITATTAPNGLAKLFGKSLKTGLESLVSVTFSSGHIAVGPTFSYLAATSSGTGPSIDSIGQSSGPVSGGNQITIYGTGFTGATSVTFGGVASTHFSVKSDSMIQVTAPAETTSTTCLTVSHSKISGLCQSQIVVTSPAGSSPTYKSLKPVQGYLNYDNFGVPMVPAGCGCEVFASLTEYDYQAAPKIFSLQLPYANSSQPYASPYGGDALQVLGSGYSYLTLGSFIFGTGATTTTSYNISSVYYNKVYLSTSSDPTPSTVVNGAPVRASTSGGLSNPRWVPYGPAPMVTSISTQLLPSAGGPVITLNGGGFTGTTDVIFNSFFGLPSTDDLNFTVDSPTQISLVAPSLVPGTYEIIVINKYADSYLFLQPPIGPPRNAFQSVAFTTDSVTVTYPGGPSLQSASGATSCSVDGGCTVVLSGTNLGGPTPVVYVGSQVAALTSDVTVGSVSTLTVTVPPSLLGAIGSFTITVATDHGTTPATTAALETYY